MIFLALADPTGMEILDLPIAIMFVATGIIFLAIRKPQSSARMERVKRGELSLKDAEKKNRTFSLCAYSVIGIGVGLLVAHFVKF